jgi:hypothetical protein
MIMNAFIQTVLPSAITHHGQNAVPLPLSEHSAVLAFLVALARGVRDTRLLSRGAMEAPVISGASHATGACM